MGKVYCTQCLLVDSPNLVCTKVTLQSSSVICGFGKAKFKEAPKDPQQIDHDNEFLFEVTGDSYGVLDNEFGTISEHLDKAKQAKPGNCRVCYHKTSQDPDGNWILQKEPRDTTSW